MIRRLLPVAALLVLVAVLLYADREPDEAASDAGRASHASDAPPRLVARARPGDAPTAPVAGGPVPAPDPADPADSADPAGADDVETFRIRGRVLTGAGDPVVGVLTYCDGLGWKFTDEEGRFTWEVDAPGTHVLKASLGGCFSGAATAEVHVDDRGASPEVVLRFPPEGTLRGHALLPDGRPASGVLVKVTTTTNDAGLGRFATGLWSMDDGRSWLAFRTDADGTFGFAGLHPRSTYALWTMGDDGRPRRHPDDVRAGETDVEVVVERHRLRVVVFDAGNEEPLDAARILTDPLTEARLAEDELDLPLNGGADWDETDHVAPVGTTMRVVVFRPGYRIHDTRYRMRDTWGEQELKVPLERVADPPLLRIACRGPDGALLEGVPLEVSCLASDGEPETRLEPSLIEVRGIQETRSFASTRLRIRTGNLRTAVAWSALENLLPASTTVDVPASGEVWARLDLARGGSFRLTFHDPAVRGTYQGSYFLEHDLRDEAGEAVDGAVRWYYPAESWEMVDWTGSTVLLTDGPRVGPVLPAGQYRLTLSPSFASHELKTITVPITIETGKTTEVAVHLVR